MAVYLSDSSGNRYALTVNATDDSLVVTSVSSDITPSLSGTYLYDTAGAAWKLTVASDGSLSLARVTSGAPVFPNPITAQDLISSSLRLINVLASGEQIPIYEANDGLMVLNQMIDAWNADRLAVFTIQQNDFPFILGQQTYKVGLGGDFNMPRPARIDGVSAILLTNPSNPIEVPITPYTFEDWQREIPVKAVNSSFPQVYYDDNGFPFRNISFWPIPLTQPNNVRFYSWAPLAAQSLTSQVNFPPGYAEAFRYNLAVRLGAEFAQPISPDVRTIAAESLARVKTMNAPQLELKSDLLSIEPGYNYKQDMFGIPY